MYTLELYSFAGHPSVRNNLYIAYFRSDVELQDMLSQLLASASFNRQMGHYILQATGTGGAIYRYTDRPTVEMHQLLSNYKKVFNKAYEIAQRKIWPFAWQNGGEGYRINCALKYLDIAREELTSQAWGGLST